MGINPVTLILLSLNEIDGVREIVPKIPTGCVNEILAVDGGSTDGTLEFFAEQGIRTLIQQKRGRGEAMRIGVRQAQNPWVVFFSPDGNENPEDIPRIVQGLVEGYDMVVASRFMLGAQSEDDNKNSFMNRRWGNLVLTKLTNLLWSHPALTTDALNGFRGINRQVFETLELDAEGFTIELQMTLRARQKNLKVLEIPTIESDRIGRGVSKVRAVPVGLECLKLICKEKWRRFNDRREE